VTAFVALRKSFGTRWATGRSSSTSGYEHDIAGHDADVALQRIYQEKTRLVMICVCQRYQQ